MQQQRYKATIAYDGSQFSGYQIQPTVRTVQAELEKALRHMHKGNLIKVTGSGRTDAGVHARGQVIHFDSPLQLSPERWVKALNTLLPFDIVMINVKAVHPHFHARLDASKKTYKYFIYRSKTRDPFRRHYAAHYPYPLDMKKMEEAACQLIGTHDFTSFCSAKSDIDQKVRTLSQLDIEANEDECIFTFTGNGFLYHMVRIIVGTLLDIGNGKISPNELTSILRGKDRRLAGKTAPAEGLYLWEVFYEK